MLIWKNEEAFSNLTNLEYTVGGGVDSPQGVIIIPEGTTSISGWNNFTKCNKITSVILPDSLTYIQGNNFQSMAALTEITVGNGMNRWVRGNFYNCPNFNKVNIKDLDAWLNITFESTGSAETPLAVARHLYLNGTEVTSVDFTGKTIVKDKVLWGCLGLTSVVLPNTIASIGSSAFRDCDNLVIADLNLPNLAILGSHAFENTKVQTITDLGSVASIPVSCFNGCNQLTSVTMPSSLASIGNSAFEGCSNLVIQDLNLPNLTTLGSYAFKGTKVQVVSNLGSTTSIGNDCFMNCLQLTSVSIPNSVTSIGGNAFRSTLLNTINGGSNIEVVGKDAFYNTPWFNNQSNGFVVMGTALYIYKGETPENYDAVIPDGVKYVCAAAFKGKKKLKSVYFPDSVTSVDGGWKKGIFDGCSNLQSVRLSENLTKIGDRMLIRCTSLTQIDVPSSVTSVESQAFDTTPISSFTFRSTTPPTLGSKVFDYVTVPFTIYVPAGSVSAYQSASGWSEYADRIQAIPTA